MKQTNGKIWKRRTLSLLLALMVSVSSFAPAFAEGEAPAEGMESSSMSAETFEPGSAGTSEEGGSSGTESGSRKAPRSPAGIKTRVRTDRLRERRHRSLPLAKWMAV